MAQVTKDERDALLKDTEALWVKIFKKGKDLPVDELRALKKQYDAMRDEYFARLPQVIVGRCPFTSSLATVGLDIYGLDGPAWCVNAPVPPAQGGPHLVTYLGALHLNGNSPDGAAPGNSDEILPGPEVPFIVPRLLRNPAVRCVISSCAMDPFTIYFMAYFAQPPLLGQELHQEWLRTTYWYSEGGRNLWYSANDTWDFGDTKYNLLPASDSKFPFTGIDGVKVPRSIRQGKVYLKNLPDGSPIVPGD
jgi:hypothetical protein